MWLSNWMKYWIFIRKFKTFPCLIVAGVSQFSFGDYNCNLNNYRVNRFTKEYSACAHVIHIAWNARYRIYIRIHAMNTQWTILFFICNFISIAATVEWTEIVFKLIFAHYVAKQWTSITMNKTQSAVFERFYSDTLNAISIKTIRWK